MWRLGTLFHEMAYGLLSVFVPMYIATSVASGGLGGRPSRVGHNNRPFSALHHTRFLLLGLDM